MSTRSGKRIHSSFHENIIKVDVENAAKSERKTRSKKVKENLEDTASVFKTKKRNNYVSYPTDDEGGTDVDHKQDEGKTKSRKHTLKERNTIHTADLEPSDQKKSTRTTRRTRKITETEELQETQPEESKNECQKPKKSKKKKKSTEPQDTEGTKKIKKKKKGRRSSSMIVEDIEPEANKNLNKSLNKSSMSVDSFHSAADSPQKLELPDDIHTVSSTPLDQKQEQPGRQTRSCKITKMVPEKVSRKRKSSAIAKDTTVDNDSESSKDSKRHKLDTNNAEKDTEKSFDDNTLTEENMVNKIKINTVYQNDDLNNSSRSTRKSKIIETLEKIGNTIQNPRKSIINTTYDKDSDKRLSVKDSTFEDTVDKRKSVKNTTFDKDTVDKMESVKDTTFGKRKSVKDTSFDKDATFDKDTVDKMESVKNTTFDKDTVDKRKSVKDTTFDKDTVDKRKSVKDTTFDKDTEIKDTTYDKNETFDKDLNSTDKRKSVKDTTFDKNSTFDKIPLKDSTFDKDTAPTVKDATFDKDLISEDSSNAIDSTFDKNTTNSRKSIINITIDNDDTKNDTTEKLDTKLDTTFDKNSKSSLISSDNSNVTLDKSDISRISITSDESKENIENIVNTTPVLIESSLEESQILEKSPIISKTPDTTVKSPITPLKREGTFTKEEALQPDVLPSPGKSVTPNKSQRRVSLPSPGCTPFPNKTQERILNITRSIEKRRSSVGEAAPRSTRVMFCSPAHSPGATHHTRRKVIKSSLKGSNKSFIFDDSAIEPRAARKRSYTQSDAEDVNTKRKRLADTPHTSAHRLPRTRTSSASAKLTQNTPSNKLTPSKAKITRTKLPNFAVLHQKQFDKMESLDECQERKAKRAKQLLTPTGSVTVLERTSPKEPEEKPNPQPLSQKQTSEKESSDKKSSEKQSSKKQTKDESKKPETPIKSLPTLKSLNPGYSRFGFRLNLDVNPFTFTTKTDAIKPKEKRPNFTRQATLPSLAGATSLRREEAKKTIMREKSFTDKRNVNRNENRTIIKGVRTNRRFELQMRMRNIE